MNIMKLIENKTKEMLISINQNPAPIPPLIINSNAVERVYSVKILGVWLFDDLFWKYHVKYHNVKCIRFSKLLIYHKLQEDMHEFDQPIVHQM